MRWGVYVGVLVNLDDYKVKNMVNDIIKNIVESVYNKCITNIKNLDVYSYIDVDIFDLIESEVSSLVVTEVLKGDIDAYVSDVGALYIYLTSLDSENGNSIDSNSILLNIIEDELTERFLRDGYKVVLKLDNEDICIWDGELIIELSNNNVFDRIIVKVLDSIPYELIYIR